MGGACPAGGCGLAICCDYRIITADGTMGLNEVAIGIQVPKTWSRIFLDVAGIRQGEKLLLSGAMPKTPELLRLGMVDEAVETREMLLPAAEKVMEKRLRCPYPGHALTKQALRGAKKQAWEADVPEEYRDGWKNLSNPKTVKALSRHPALASKAPAKPAAKL